MPRDIRSFFGGAPPRAKDAATSADKKPEPKAKGRASRRVVEDDSDDEPQPPKSIRISPRKSKKRSPSPVGEVTTTSDYFGGKNKPKRSQPVRGKPSASNTGAATGSPKAAGSRKRGITPRVDDTVASSPRKPAPRLNGAGNSDAPKVEDVVMEDHKETEQPSTGSHDEDTDDDLPVAKPRAVTSRRGKAKKEEEEDYNPDEEMGEASRDDDMENAPAKQTSGRTSRKRKSAPEVEEAEEDHAAEQQRKRSSGKPSPANKRVKQEDKPKDSETQAILDSIPLVRPPSPPVQSDQPQKFNYRAHAANTGPPPAAGTKEIPVGADNCLAGLTFVFTGLLEQMQRDEAQALVKRYGGKVTSAPSKKTSYVVLGSDAGPKKLQVIKQNNIKTINEDGLFQLIRSLPANGGDSKAAAAYEEKQQAEAKKIKEMAAEIEKEERRRGGAGGAGGGKASVAASANSPPGKDARLWTEKYAPTQISQICGNKTQVEKLQRWLRNFPKNQRTGFKLAGPEGSGIYRAVMIHGPPGIGKTTAAHLVAKLEGYDIVESNASDTRSKKLVETGLRGVLSTTSLLGYFAGQGKEVEASKKKLVLIMDEVDGMSAGDRGGVGALAAVCKKTQIPMILICNDRRLPKMKPFDYCTYDLPFRRPTVDQIRSRIMTIGYRENLKLPANVVNALIEGTHADIRQVVNMISTAKLDQQTMDFEKGKEMSKAWQKHVILKPWDIAGKILGGGLFAESSKATLNDKIELYFNDHELSYLMLQENYLGTNPILAGRYTGKERNLKLLELADKAAESISDGDLVDSMIHGSQQQWSLMPTHAVFSFVRPASFIAGGMTGQTRFPAWLGKNSSQGKLTRMVKEIQGHMRLRSSGDRHEVRQQYVPALWQKLVKRLELEGKDAVPEIIDLMDSYFLTKEDFDAISELGVGPMDQEKIKIESQAKATFTRLYNQQSHPLPFMKASSVTAPKKAVKEQPDLEEAVEESDEGEILEDVKEDEEDEDLDLSKDKYVKQPKKKAAPKKGGKAKAAKTKASAPEESDDAAAAAEDSKATKQKKGKGKAVRKAK